jgi:hypothetical protein
MRKMSFLVACLATACLGGDPGWNYVSEDGRPVQDDGLRYDVAEVSGLGLRVHASLLAGSLDAELDVTNVSAGPLQVDLGSLVVTDKAGKKLSKRMDLPTRRCGGRQSEELCVLSQGQSCRLGGTFQALPLAAGVGGLFGRRNHDLETIEVSLSPGVRRGPTEVAVSTKLKWTE